MNDEILLSQFLQDNDIDLEALKRIKHRLFIVGRFNQRNKGADPDLYLFTNRGDLSDRYRQNFKAVLKLEYDQFVKALRPAIAERIEKEGRFPVVRQFVPQGDDALDGTCVIDTFNFFFQRAIANPDQDSFRESAPGLPRELLQDDSGEGGKAIFQLIRKNLQQFSEFQPRTHEIILAVSNLLDRCSRQNGMPPYAEQGGLPPGFPEHLIDFLYAQDPSEQFSLDGLDLSAEPWAELNRREASRRMFCNVITAFRDEILAAKHEQFNGIQFAGKTLNEQARAALPRDLVQAFGKARDAFNGLRQILRSKVLLSMVLEWLLKAYYQIDVVKELGSANDRTSQHEAIENAILRDWKANDLAEPVKRPNLSERRKFSRSLTENFELLLKSVLNGDEGAIQSLPAQIRRLAEDVRKNQELVAILNGVSGSELGAEYQEAFVQAAKVVLLDILCPTLFQNPILSVQMLRQFFRKETMAAYLTAVFLDDKSQDAVRRIAENHVKYFQSKIDDVTQNIRDVGEVQERLLHEFLDLLAKPDIGRRLREGLRVLSEAHTILENAKFETLPGEEPGAGKISAICPDPKYKPSVRIFSRTAVREEDVTEPLEKVVDAEVQKQVAQFERVVEKMVASGPRTKTAAAETASPGQAATTSAASPQAGGSGAGGVAGPGVLEAVNGAAEALAYVNEIEKGAAESVKRVLAKAFGADPPAKLKESQVAALARDARQELISDRLFVDKVKENVRAFEQALYLIYQRYNENPDKTTYRNRVERLTLINMMLLFQRELGLGQVSSNLHHLLLDLVQHLDPEKPDPRAFLREKSLTVYFDNADLERGGFTDLMSTLKAQGYDNLEQTVDFVSELRGVKYLMDVVSESGDRQAEIILVNATAREFLDWLQNENLRRTVESEARLQSGSLVTTGRKSQWLVLPGLVYLTDVAFGGSANGSARKMQFISGLAQEKLAERELSLLLPPMCISTGYRRNDEGWIEQGKAWAKAAAGAPAPIIVVGPTSFMNQPQDAFKTYLSAGYLVAAHFLGGPVQRVQNHGINDKSEGRFRVVGYGSAPMKESLDCLMWGRDNDTYAFAVDFYLYMVLTLLATAFRRTERGVDVQEFYKCFFYDEFNKWPYLSSAVLDDALIGNALQFSMDHNLAAQRDLASVTLKRLVKRNENMTQKITDVAWFNIGRAKAELPPFTPAAQDDRWAGKATSQSAV
jgi:hypothetical protein